MDILSEDIIKAKEEYNQIKEDINEKRRLSISSTNGKALDEIKDIRKKLERYKIDEKLAFVNKGLYWFYNTVQGMNLLVEKNLSIDLENKLSVKSMEDLKRQVRMLKSETREYEQKIDQELIIRGKLEEEIKSLKKIIKDSQKVNVNFKIPCTNANTNRSTDIIFEDGIIKIEGIERTLNSIYFRDLKNLELHYLPVKKRALCIVIHLLEEEIKCSSSTGTRRSLKALEKDLEKEHKILKGLDNLLKVLTGSTKEEAELQKSGSLKKIAQLEGEIEKAKSSSIFENKCSYEIPDSETVYEFNNHLFYNKTVAKGTLCDHCNEVLYGMVNQAYCCKDCLIVVHKSCYVLLDVSCELNKAIKGGKTLYQICRTMEEKDKLLRLNKAL